MITHGWPKFLKLLEGGEIQFGDPIGLGPAFSLVLAVFAEFFCSILIGIGLGTRLASIPLMITMFVAAFISHGEDPFRRKETALLYLLFYLVLLIIGSRKYSVDYLITRKPRN
jgi:putative oxidoreductase